ncbi:membrane dipeptidase [Methylobacterium ajmalii]|uniref:membrane dipeptidase n=1 Tax=Methylobacterium ajmalii TaxID=2738439 RepID=UPI002F35A060
MPGSSRRPAASSACGRPRACFPTSRPWPRASPGWRMADVVGADHVGLGTDMMGLVGPSALPDYAALPDLAAHLLARFTPDETAGILGGNYLRVARACLAA